MAALPYIQLYVSDYLADTAHLNAAQHGAYLLLILNYWQRGKPLNNANDRLANVARMSNEEWQQNKADIAEFFVIDGDTWSHKRIDADLAAVSASSIKKSEAGKASVEAKKAKKEQSSKSISTDGKQLLDECSTGVEQTFNYKEAEADVDTEVNPSLSLGARDSENSALPLPTRKGEVCGLLRKAGMADAAPHYLTDETWDAILAKRSNEEIVEVAKAKMAAMPNQRIGLKYIAPALLDNPKPIEARARASPSLVRSGRQSRIDNYAAEAAAARGDYDNEHGTGRTERDITGEAERIA